jgi:SHS2 domain-containing protein
MGYELREHTADVAVEATGGTLGSVFGAVADGMAAAMCADPPAAGGDQYAVTVTAESREALLFDYLDELIYERDVRSVLPVDNAGRVERVAVSGGTDDPERTDTTARTQGPADGDDERWRIQGEYRGVPLDQVDARDLKAVTYSQMALDETPEGWRAYVVFDV